jgi:hypothetical protein
MAAERRGRIGSCSLERRSSAFSRAETGQMVGGASDGRSRVRMGEFRCAHELLGAVVKEKMFYLRECRTGSRCQPAWSNVVQPRRKLGQGGIGAGPGCTRRCTRSCRVLTELGERASADSLTSPQLQIYATLSPLLRPPTSAPFLLFTFYLFHLVFLILHTISSSLHSSTLPQQAFVANTTLTAVHAAFLLALVGTTTSYRLTPVAETEGLGEPTASKEDDQDAITLPSPEGDVTLFSWIIFSWVRPIMELGQKARLDYADVWKLPSNMSSEGVWRSAQLLR